MAAAPAHGPGIHEVVCLANGYPVGTRGCVSPSDLREMLRRFPAGQFVVVTQEGGLERIVGVAVAMRTDYPPSARPLGWREMIGDLGLRNHDPAGAWLYGVEKAVHPDHQGHGVGSALYRAQFDLVRRLGLKGMYAGGMLKGYRDHKDTMSAREYAGKVMRGELFDPTVSVQMRRGFKPCGLIENYAWDKGADHTGMLIVWEARAPQPPARPPGAGLGARL